jgi:hypothetical protein
MFATQACFVLALAFTGDDGLQRAIDLLRAGDARAALAAADAEPDDLRRAQARVYVRHQAGDLEGALVAARSGSDAHPEDAWIADRWCWIALTLRRAGPARQALERLEHAAAALRDPERTRWTDAAHAARSEVDALDVARGRRDAADRAARIVSCTAAGLSILLLGALALAPRRTGWRIAG